MTKLSVRDLPTDKIRGKTALMRVDFNCPLDSAGNISDDLRIVSSLPTIRYLLERGSRIVLVSHLGRPKGKWDDALSLDPVARHLSGLLDRKVAFIKDRLDGPPVEKIRRAADQAVFLLENIRFYPGEEANTPDFSKSLAKLGHFYVNDAFGTAHRAHASTVGVTGYLQPAAAGLLMQAEIESMSRILSKPQRPFVAVIGGAKIKDKIGVIRNLFGKIDSLLIGGAMANTFLAATGKTVGASKYDKDQIDVARSLIEESEKAGCGMVLPSDCVVTRALDAQSPGRVVGANEIPEGWMAVDIGPLTREAFRERIRGAKTVVWNGPMGVCEVDPFSLGTLDVARIVADATRQGAFTLLGGGDSVAAVRKAGLEREISHISTGGGASLEFLAGKTLPGIEALSDKATGKGGGKR